MEWNLYPTRNKIGSIHQRRAMENVNVNFKISSETLNLLNEGKKKSDLSQKELTGIFESIVIEHLIMKKKISEGYKVFLGKNKKEIDYEFKLNLLDK